MSHVRGWSIKSFSIAQQISEKISVKERLVSHFKRINKLQLQSKENYYFFLFSNNSEKNHELDRIIRFMDKIETSKNSKFAK